MESARSDDVGIEWRGRFTNDEFHAEAFDTRVVTADEWDMVDLVERHSLGWVVARDEDRFVGFANVVWDGLVHAWLQDVMVAPWAR